MTTDKTGAETVVNLDRDHFTISAGGQPVGNAYFADRAGTRVFYHTEVEKEYEGRGLATILVGEALEQTRNAGMRIVPVCEVVARYVQRHPELSDVVDPPTAEITDWVAGR